jgi:hypothetical protein
MTKQQDYINPNRNWQIQITSVLLKLKLILAFISADSTSAASSSSASETLIQQKHLLLSPLTCIHGVRKIHIDLKNTDSFWERDRLS